MSNSKDLRDFPDVQAKLQKPIQQSAFDKQRAEAEAKRQREEVETAAVYKDFLRSFDRDEGDDDGIEGDGASAYRGPSDGRSRLGYGAPGPAAGGASRRHFGTSGLKTGPGSLGPPPTSFGKKRSFQDFSHAHRERLSSNYDDRDGGGRYTSKTFDDSDDEETGYAVDRAEEKAIARPTLRLLNLPPGTSPSLVKALIPSNLVVENVRMEASASHGSSERRSMAAIVTLSQETPANEIDSAVSSLQNQYIGYGHYLSLHRHLSSAVSTTATLPKLGYSSADSNPFGAKPVEQQTEEGARQHPQGFHRGFAPPSTYEQPAAGFNRASLLHVPVKPPNDVKTIQSINKTIERILEHGPEFEALLMSRPEVQREEKWAWIWDARSAGGIWYRWRLWEVITGGSKGNKGKYVPLFDGGHAWKSPEKSLVFEYATQLHEFVSDSEYESGDEMELDGEGNRDGQADESEKAFLNPLDKARLTHLLARLATTLSKLRNGDLARITAFAITHASHGVDEVVDMIVSNIERPFSLTTANPDWKSATAKEQAPPHDGPQQEQAASEGTDTSSASLVGLYVVSDILASSSSTGVRHAWRFRQLFETAFRDRNVFERLGMMADKLGWGRLRAEKWKRSINFLLHTWEGWSAFPAESQELFVRTFEHPPALQVEDKSADLSKKGKWKSVEAKTTEGLENSRNASADVEDDVDGERIEDEDVAGEPIDEDDVEGEPIEEDDVEGEPIEEDDIEGEPIGDDDIEGEPVQDDDIAGDPMEEDDIDESNREPSSKETGQSSVSAEAKVEASDGGQQGSADTKAQPRMRRMRAVDMFADSDGSDNGT